MDNTDSTESNGQVPTPAEVAAKTTASTAEKSAEAPDTFDRGYAEKLRKEVAGYRSKIKGARATRGGVPQAAGWRDKPARDSSGWPHDESLADGRRWASERVGASKFPKDWADQNVDAVSDTVEDPDSYYSTELSWYVWKHIEEEAIKAECDVLRDGKIRFKVARPVGHVRKKAKHVDR